MEKVFKNKKLAYVIIGILLALQLTQSIANWCGGGFNGGSLILCILMLGLLTLVGVGIAKNNKLLTIVSGASILSVVIYVLVSQYSGLIQEWFKNKIPVAGLVANIFATIATLLLIGCFILAILEAFKVNKNLKTINTVFSLSATIMFIVSTLILLLVFTIIPSISGDAPETFYSAYDIVRTAARDFFAIFFALLIPCVWHQVDSKE